MNLNLLDKKKLAALMAAAVGTIAAGCGAAPVTDNVIPEQDALGSA